MVGMNNGVKFSNVTLADNAFLNSCLTLFYIILDKKLNTNCTVYIGRTQMKSVFNETILSSFLIKDVERVI